MKYKQIQITVQGKVQGVGFRFATQRAAQELGVCGWVRNLENGSVETFAAGTEEQIRHFIEWCRTGPPGARVDTLTTISEEILEELPADGFKILR